MNKEDMIVEAAKRTLVELKKQVKSTPPMVVPFAVVGLIVGHWWATVVVIILMLVWEGYEHYNDVVAEEVAGIKSASKEAADSANNVQSEEVSTENKEQ
ncbi:hypothetical protein FDG95_gp433 [Pectobacterium phage vB_PcaM_CBB]|uniref:Putative membrane protein n=1 Tax=Pectobacterium phage vB_PcaM_CBB TaxID=2772511 RepID=A0A1L2CVR8_9CAUD|nr:hypothetical protein FDG95_gp433 [Pectobacterium phage vB_PcaM_CBB]AMM44109.1 putative membrane protein [Pectobacterium phage vB_PcaM_CBB]